MMKILRILAEKISALQTETYLAKRAAQGNRQKFENVLAHVADVEPEDERDLL